MSNAIYPAAVRGLGFTVLKVAEWPVIVQSSSSFVEARLLQAQNPRWHFELLYDFLIDNPQRPTATLMYTDLQTLMGFYLARGGNFDDFLFLDPDDNSVGPALVTATWVPNFPYALGSIILDGSHAQQVTVAPQGARSGISTPGWNHAGGNTTDSGPYWPALTWHDLGASVGYPNPKAQLQLVNDGAGNYYSPVQRNMGGEFQEDVTDLVSGITVYANGALQTGGGGNYSLLGPGLSIPGFASGGLYLAWTAPPTAPITATFNFYFRVRFETSKTGFEKWLNQWWTAAGQDYSQKSDAIKMVTSRPPGV